MLVVPSLVAGLRLSAAGVLGAEASYLALHLSISDDFVRTRVFVGRMTLILIL